MRILTRDRVRELLVVLREWRKYVDQLEMRASGSRFAEIPRFSDEHPEAVRAARELVSDCEQASISVPHLNQWLLDPDDDIPEALMSELGRIAMGLPRRNGLSFEDALGRKTSHTLREAIVAIRAAIPHLQSKYERDEEVPIMFDRLLDPSLKTPDGSTMHTTLRKLYDILDRERLNHPMINTAADKIGVILQRS